ncbi:MAG: tetraacyldisaccharide 4'-kinase [Desulfuromonadaceae bacterium]|nr:tetraacyldisaccharide 4'-kinase [Desulfuromonadaceae bacterium]
MNVSYHTYWRELASGKRTSLADNLALLFLTPLAWLYSLVLQLRAGLYLSGIFKTHRLPRPVISVGNITVGGTGKTPVTAYIARFLLEQGYKVAVLSRGYGGSLEGHTSIVSDGATIMMSAGECGDEPYLLASTVPGVMVVIGTDRYAAGQLAMQQLAPDVFLLDDGFQHLRLHRDLNILLLDFSRPFGNNLTLPAGLLRENSVAARRADFVIFTRSPLGAQISSGTQGIPGCLSCHAIVDLLPLGGGAPVPIASCRDKKLLAFAGIADPDSFFEGLRSQGLNLVSCLRFPDHVVYNRERFDEIADAMRKSGADLLVTTEKDGVKLKDISRELAAKTLLARLELTIDNPELLKGLLTGLLQQTQPPPTPPL